MGGKRSLTRPANVSSKEGNDAQSTQPDLSDGLGLQETLFSCNNKFESLVISIVNNIKKELAQINNLMDCRMAESSESFPNTSEKDKMIDVKFEKVNERMKTLEGRQGVLHSKLSSINLEKINRIVDEYDGNCAPSDDKNEDSCDKDTNQNSLEGVVIDTSDPPSVSASSRRRRKKKLTNSNGISEKIFTESINSGSNIEESVSCVSDERVESVATAAEISESSAIASHTSPNVAPYAVAGTTLPIHPGNDAVTASSAPHATESPDPATVIGPYRRSTPLTFLFHNSVHNGHPPISYHYSPNQPYSHQYGTPSSPYASYLPEVAEPKAPVSSKHNSYSYRSSHYSSSYSGNSNSSNNSGGNSSNNSGGNSSSGDNSGSSSTGSSSNSNDT